MNVIEESYLPPHHHKAVMMWMKAINIITPTASSFFFFDILDQALVFTWWGRKPLLKGKKRSKFVRTHFFFCGFSGRIQLNGIWENSRTAGWECSYLGQGLRLCYDFDFKGAGAFEPPNVIKTQIFFSILRLSFVTSLSLIHFALRIP